MSTWEGGGYQIKEGIQFQISGYWAAWIINCSRWFLHTSGEPIPAVNLVALGLKDDSLFGFRAGNGACKTRLIKVITSLLPPSDRTIEIFGEGISLTNDPIVLLIYHQLNIHRCEGLSLSGHFIMDSVLCHESAIAQIDRLLADMESESVKTKSIQESNGRDARKLAIALSFLDSGKFILFDESTASFSLIAHRRVDEMILHFKSENLFLLCYVLQLSMK
jgi:ABC-type multidrug transport system ATPase subunit